MSETLNIDAMLGGSVHRMSHVYRYSSIPVIRRENVAEHSWFVSFYSFLIGKDLEKTEGLEIDFGKLLSRAMVHDIDESHTGDFLRHVKYGHPDLKRALDETSIAMIDMLGDALGVHFKHEWSTAKADDIEGHIIQVVDLARVLSYVWEEINSGNQHVSYILKECNEHIRKFIEDHPKSPVNSYAKRIYTWAYERYSHRDLEDRALHSIVFNAAS